MGHSQGTVGLAAKKLVIPEKIPGAAGAAGAGAGALEAGAAGAAGWTGEDMFLREKIFGMNSFHEFISGKNNGSTRYRSAYLPVNSQMLCRVSYGTI